jgi:predicted nuclease with TOPRIM domain
MTQLISAIELKYESKLADLKRSLSIAEKERMDSEVQWSRKLREKVQESDDLRRTLGSATKTKEQDEGVLDDFKAEVERLQAETQRLQSHSLKLQTELDRATDAQVVSFLPICYFCRPTSSFQDVVKNEETELAAKITVLQQYIDEGKSRESQLRLNNKVLFH